MLNGIWLGLMLGSVLCAAYLGRMDAVKAEGLAAAREAVDLVIRLVGVMALFLGLMRVARDGGLLHLVTRALSPLLRRLFPEVPPDHPAMGAMVMNLASNVLGLGNAATPFGLKAMVELEKLNPRPGVASDPMVLFLAINASSVALIPTGVIALRESLKSVAPDAIWGPTLIATSFSTVVAVSMALALRRLPRFRADRYEVSEPAEAAPGPADAVEVPVLPEPPGPMSPGARLVVYGFLVALLGALVLHVARAPAGTGAGELFRELLGSWFLPVFMVSLLLFGVAGRVRVYEAAVEGAKEALEVGVRIVPFLVMILVALGMFRASGAMELFVGLLDPLLGGLIPAEALPMAILRPLSGSGAYGLMVEIMETHGPDSFVGMLVSSLQGSTETTFYVLTIYLGAARVRESRYALGACLSGDLAGVVAATAACHWLLA
ncbi:MAG: nucleoside recognition domain-containing protein [Myxococcota bacterium]|nr:nucleoside recognition domain-containing protein [Myxococcota bacterium]